MTDLRRALLDAHVRHVLERSRGDLLRAAIDDEVTNGFAWLAHVRLGEVATADDVVAAIERYAVDLRLGGGIAELAGEMSNRVYRSPSSAATPLAAIFPAHLFEAFAEKVIALAPARRYVFHLLATSPAYRAFVANALERAIVDRVLRREGREAKPLLDALVGPMAEAVGLWIARFLETHGEAIADETERRFVEALDDRKLRALFAEIWETIGPMRLSEAFSLITEHDLEDFVVLGYEFWLQYRKTPYFRAILRELVGHFFAKYGAHSLASIAADMGITSAMIAREAHALIVPLAEQAAIGGYLEERVRARLASFYESPEVSALLAATATRDGS